MPHLKSWVEIREARAPSVIKADTVVCSRNSKHFKMGLRLIAFFKTTLFRLSSVGKKICKCNSSISFKVIYFDIHLLLFLHTTFTFYKAACKIRFQRKIARFLVVTVVNQQCETLGGVLKSFFKKTRKKDWRILENTFRQIAMLLYF